ncbi:hypothetical protein [Desulfosoma caldarium]|uniref:Uncharacterized protein n=1 Tax=Desulfosoma caldarium TaxID=610254 RepID=A0A3N1VGH7_9BACT|nr:hypothetical protein [Desulfosoma caldarium]ROR01936.1 hypothetical protein EDC27_1132 [Desulfosoma caldarium]
MNRAPARVKVEKGKLKPAIGSILKNDQGMAMVLALSAVALLSILGVWLVVQSGSTHRMTKSVERREAVFNLAEGALQLSWYCLQRESNEKILKNLNKNQDVTPSESVVSYMKADQPVDNQTKASRNLTPRIIFLDAKPVPGWDMTKFRGYYYLAQGQGEEDLPDQKGGPARSEVVMLVQKIGQVRSR